MIDKVEVMFAEFVFHSNCIVISKFLRKYAIIKGLQTENLEPKVGVYGQY